MYTCGRLIHVQVLAYRPKQSRPGGVVVEVLTVVVTHLRGGVGRESWGDFMHWESATADIGADRWGIRETRAAHAMVRVLEDDI